MPYTSITKHLPLRLPKTQNERLALILGTTAALGTGLLLPTIYRDYLTFKSYGPGGVPNNVFGWIIVRALFQPLRAEMFSTDVYTRQVDALEGHGGGEGYLELSDAAARSVTDRPFVGPHVVPQRQMSQLPGEEIKEKLAASFRAFGHRNHHLVKFERSLQEAHAQALFLADHLPRTEISRRTNGELAHLHSGGEFSGHFCLAPADCKKVIEAGWGQRHGFSGTSALKVLSLGTMENIPVEYLLIYAPRTEAEIETFMSILAASVKYTTGREDVR